MATIFGSRCATIEQHIYRGGQKAPPATQNASRKSSKIRKLGERDKIIYLLFQKRGRPVNKGVYGSIASENDILVTISDDEIIEHTID